jgi:hypothetical protein
MRTKFGILLTFAWQLVIISAMAQSYVPQKFNYQGIARLPNGNPITNTQILVKFSLIADDPQGSADYVEWHETTTNAFGLFTVQIGGGTVITGTTIGALSWGNTRYVKIDLDADGNANGVNYMDMGVTQLVSVPYAISADVAYDLTLPYSGSADNGIDPVFDVTTTALGVVGGTAIQGNSMAAAGTGVRGEDANDVDPGIGVAGYSISGTGGYFSSINGASLATGGAVGIATLSPTTELDVNGQIRIRGGGPGNGKVLTSDANGLATWQTPSGGGGGGYWTASGNDIYNNNADYVGIGTSTPAVKLHVEGRAYVNSADVETMRVQSSGIGNVGLNVLSEGPAITSSGLFGLDALGTNTGVIGTSAAQTDGVGVSGVAICSTCDAIRATSDYGTAIRIVQGKVVDDGGKFMFRVSANPTDLSQIDLIQADQQSDYVVLQPIGNYNGSVNHYLYWNGTNWTVRPTTGLFDQDVQFNVLLVHYGN